MTVPTMTALTPEAGDNVEITPPANCINLNHTYRHSVVMVHACHGVTESFLLDPQPLLYSEGYRCEHLVWELSKRL